VNEILDAYKTLQREFPRARIQASTFDNYVRDLMTVESKLPIVTQEVGDTWIHGSNSFTLFCSFIISFEFCFKRSETEDNLWMVVMNDKLHRIRGKLKCFER
jgi:hypothetical protein